MRGRATAMWAAAASLAATFVLSTLPTPLYVTYRQAFGFSQIVLTIVYAAYVVGALAPMFFLGRLSDQIGRRPVVLASLALATIATATFLFATGTAWLFIARILSGLAVALASGACTAWVVELHPSGDKARGTEVAIGANLVGLGAGAAAAGLLAEIAPAPLHLPYVALLPILLFAFVATHAPRETVRNRKPLARASIKPRLGVPEEARGAFLFPAIGAFATFSVLGFCSALLPSVLAREFHETSHALAGGLVGVLFLAGAVVIVAARKTDARRGTMAGLVLLLPGTGLLVLAEATRSMPLLLVGTLVAGAASGLGYLCGLQVVNEISPEDRRSELVSTYLVVCYAAISLPVIGIGILARASSLMLADAVFAALVAAVIVGALVFGLRAGDGSSRRQRPVGSRHHA